MSYRYRNIRPAKPCDAVTLSDLALRSKAYWGYSTEFIEACRDELSYTPEQITDKQSDFQVLETSDVIIAFYKLDAQPGKNFELEALFVDPDWIGQGIGRDLLDHAKMMAVHKGGQSITVQSDPNAVAFYQSAGGVITGTESSGSIPGRTLPLLTIPLKSAVTG